MNVLGNLRRNHRQLDDFPGALGPAARQVGAAIGTDLHHVLHPMGGCHARAGKAVASPLSGPRLRWGLPARFRLAFQFGNPPLQPLNHCLQLGNDRLLLHDDADVLVAAGSGQVSLRIHSLYMT